MSPRSALALPGMPGLAGAIIKALLPALGFVLIAPLLWRFFRDTWRELDDEATEARLQLREQGGYDYRPVVMFAIVALVLSVQEYYGGSRFFRRYLRPLLRGSAHWDTYGELYSYSWWALSRIIGYTLVPLGLWKIIFRRDSLRDMGLRTRGLLKHAWIYGLCLLVVVPCVYVVAQSPEFANYYPFYKRCSRSWVDLLIWESLYLAQFFALEVFFRGFMLVPLRRSLGSGAIFAMCVPYVMIHYGKPYLEAVMAFVAGVALGSLAMRTRSIYSGFLVHVTVALLMDGLALYYGGGFPSQWWP